MLRRLVGERLENLVQETMVDAALAASLAHLCQLAPVPQLAAAVVEALPERSTSLAALAAVLQEQTVAHYRALAEANPDAFLPDLALSLNNLSRRLNQLGRREAALEPIKEGVGHYRTLAETNPDAFLPSLVSSLNNLSNRLADLGREQEADAATREAESFGRQS